MATSQVTWLCCILFQLCLLAEGKRIQLSSLEAESGEINHMITYIATSLATCFPGIPFEWVPILIILSSRLNREDVDFKQVMRGFSVHFKVDGTLRRVGGENENDYIYYYPVDDISHDFHALISHGILMYFELVVFPRECWKNQACHGLVIRPVQSTAF